jgi:rhodanese-related sulfurtransferase
MMTAVALLVFNLISLSHAAESDFDRMVDSLTSKTIPCIQPEKLDKVMKDKTSFLLLDAREPNEFAISHLQGALNVGYDKLDEKKLYSLPKAEPIVVYCSLGVRSEKVGEKLKKNGYQKVYNLYGGIFNWVNLGFPVVDGSGNVTEKIHAYSKRWGKWLSRGEKVYE